MLQKLVVLALAVNLAGLYFQGADGWRLLTIIILGIVLYDKRR